MSVALIKTELETFRKSLQKSINEMNVETTFDILIAIDKLGDKLTPNLIKESKLGNLINSIREKFSSMLENNSKQVQYQSKMNDVILKSKEIILAWKKIMESTTLANEKSKSSSSNRSTPLNVSESTVNENVSDSQSSTKPTIQKINFSIVKPTSPSSMGSSSNSSNSSSNSSGSNNNISKIWTISKLLAEPIHPQRQKIIFSFKDVLTSASKSLDHAIASEIAMMIEKEVNNSVPFEQDAKAYSAKCRSLAFNIKRNEALAENIISKSLSLDRLVNMTANELASSELLTNRNIIADKELDDKRGDWYEAHRAEIMETNGIDPNNIWSYDADNGSDEEPEIAGD